MLSLPIDIHLWPSTVVVINHYYLRPVADPQSSVLPRHHGAHHQHHLGVPVYSRYNPHGSSRISWEEFVDNFTRYDWSVFGNFSGNIQDVRMKIEVQCCWTVKLGQAILHHLGQIVDQLPCRVVFSWACQHWRCWQGSLCWTSYHHLEGLKRTFLVHWLLGYNWCFNYDLQCNQCKAWKLLEFFFSKFLIIWAFQNLLIIRFKFHLLECQTNQNFCHQDKLD